MSCADYAIGLIDETEAGKRVRERITSRRPYAAARPCDRAQAPAAGSRFAVGAWRWARGGGVRDDDAMRGVAT